MQHATLGIVGDGGLNAMQINSIAAVNGFELKGIFNPYGEGSAENSKLFDQFTHYKSLQEMLLDVEAIDILTHQASNYKFYLDALRNGKHLIFPKNLALSKQESDTLIKTAYESGSKLQVSNPHNFYHHVQHIATSQKKPNYIEIVRHDMNNNMSLWEKLLNDIDAVLHLVKSNIKQVQSNGIKFSENEVDLVKARLEFDNGCVVQLSYNHIAEKEQHYLQCYYPEGYVILDLNNFKSKSFEIKEGKVLEQISNKNKSLNFDHSKELHSFAHSILFDKPIYYTFEEAVNAIKVAALIAEKLYL